MFVTATVKRLRSLPPLAALVVLTACSGTALPRATLDSSGGMLFNGYTKSEVKCFSCHNGDASGAVGPNLGERVPKMSDEAILRAIDDGPSYMPSFKSKLTDEEKRSLVAWLRSRSHAGGKP